MKRILILLLAFASFLNVHAQSSAEISNILAASVADAYVTGQGSQLAASQNVILATAGTGSYDCQATTGVTWHTIDILIVPASGTVTAGVITFEASNDNFVSTALPLLLYDLSSTNTKPVPNFTLVASTPRHFGGKIPFRYVRARISTGITGTTTGVQAFTSFRTSEFVPMVQAVANPTAADFQVTATQTGTWTAQIGNTANTTPILANPLIPVGTTTGDTGAKTTTGNGATQTNVNAVGVQCIINMGAVTGTTPTAVIKLQGSSDAGTTWVDIPGATTASLTATGVYGITVYPGVAAVAGTTTTGTTAMVSAVIPRTWRLVWTIAGTTPSFTITNVQIAYMF